MTGQRAVIWVILGIWALAMALSVLALVAEPTGDGFTRGLNRLTGFIGWQTAGMIAALAAWLSARRLEAGDRLRLIARVPAYWALLLVLGIAILIAYGAWIGNRPPPETPAPVSAPAVTVPSQ
jgi:hypothetical protein